MLFDRRNQNHTHSETPLALLDNAGLYFSLEDVIDECMAGKGAMVSKQNQPHDCIATTYVGRGSSCGITFAAPKSISFNIGIMLWSVSCVPNITIQIV